MMNDGISRRSFMGLAGASMLKEALDGSSAVQVTASAVNASAAAANAGHRNLVLFMPDEMRADALGCFGNPLVRTPNFDHLASTGTAFANCHVQYPICGPSRCSLLTGWPTSVRGHRGNDYFLQADEPNMFRYLRESGYDVYWFGKNDAIAPDSIQSSITQWNYVAGRPVPSPVPAAARTEPRLPTAPKTYIGPPGPDRRVTAEYQYVRAAIEVLSRTEAERPFCIFLPLGSPHPPYAAPLGFQDMYKPAEITGLLPRNVPRKPAFHRELLKAYRLDGVDDAVFRQVRALYYGMASFSDWLMGELLEALEKTGRVSDTAVLLLSDHGDYAGDFGLVEKWPSGLEDVMTHVPLIIREPGQAGRAPVTDPVMLFDAMATCMDLAVAEIRHTQFARSLVPYLRGAPPPAPRTATFSEGGMNWYEPQCFEEPPPPGAEYHERLVLQAEHPETVSRAACIRTREHKLIMRPSGVSELYQYGSDPHELENRFGEKSLAAVQAELQNQLLEWYIDTSDVAPRLKDPRELPSYRPIPHIAQPASGSKLP